jgi:hypothetical protein
MTKWKASLFAGAILALLLILKVTMPNHISAEPPVAQGVRMPNGESIPKTLEQPQTVPQRIYDAVGERERALESLRKIMACPQDMGVPDDIPTYKEEGTKILFPKHGFEEMYVQGWHRCLFLIGDSTGDIRDIEWTSCCNSFNNMAAWGHGLLRGQHDCWQRIIALADIYNVELIRRVAKELHREFPHGVIWRRR